MKDGSMIGCGGGSPCSQLLNSRWSTIGGVFPVSGLAIGTYLTLFVAGFYIGHTTEISIRRLAWSAMLILSSAAAGSAVWFIIVQEWIIGDVCLYCMSTHIAGLLLAVLVFWRSTMEFDNHSNTVPPTNHVKSQKIAPVVPRCIIGPLPAIRMVLIGVLLAGGLAAAQIGMASPAVYQDGESRDSVSAIDRQSVPMIGSPDAPYVVTLFFDYQCPHCQQIHFKLSEAVRRYGGKLAFVLCPTPLNTKCNPYILRDADVFKNSCELAKIGLTVWAANRAAFPLFDNWMYSFETGDRWRPRSLESAMSKAVELVGKAKFDSARTDAWIGRYLQTSVRMYGESLQSGTRGIPKLLFGSRWLIPEPYSEDDFVMILQKSLGVPKP